jgi:chloride channel 3/4/5
MIAAITLRLLDPFGTGKLVLFQVTYDKVIMIHDTFPWHTHNFPLGLACL